MGFSKFLQNHETRRKQKWLLAKYFGKLETTYYVSMKT